MNSSQTKRHQLAYVGAVTLLGLGVLAASIAQVWLEPPGSGWLLLSLATVLTSSFTVRLPSLSAKISVSETFVFTSVLLFGSAAGTVTVVLDGLVMSLWMKRGTHSIARVLFNATAPAIALRIASEAFFWISATTPGGITRDHVSSLTLPIFAFAFLYFVLNTGLVAGAIGLERSVSPLAIWRTHFPAVSISYFVGGSVAMLVAAYAGQIDGTVVGIIAPLLVISYLTFRTSMGRIEDAERHVAQVHDLYLSTIETLAMAVDAKDQVTHGHIRRVQVYAVELAKRLGVAEGPQLKAIEAAALLHDMGKLAIPEHILNKPGKLTTAEFAKMKRHADIGADLLSSIRFPYPVVPIVRHHHENWNGTGYPTGLSGADIPLGARILSVVDCFDALTSDRPYRPALSDQEAFNILRDRRGSMYDPLVVDFFISTYAEIAPAARLAGEQARSLTGSLATPLDLDPIQDIRANAALSAALGDVRRYIDRAATIREAVAGCMKPLALVIPTTVCIVYRYDVLRDAAVTHAVIGSTDSRLGTLAIKNGEQITGWAIANDRTIANSPAILDLGDIAATHTPPLRSSLAAAIRRDTEILGAVAIYTHQEISFTEDHRYAIERLAEFLASRPDLLHHRTSSAAQQRRAG